MVLRANAITCAAIVGLFLAGCSDTPTIPVDPSTTSPGITSDPDDISHQCLAYYMLAVDTRSFDVEAIPLRSGEWHFNMVGMLNMTMGVSAAVVPGESDPMNGLFVLDISLEHPLPTATQFAGFDVKGILMTPGTLALSPFTFADVGETHLENADGYTRWWNPTEFTTPGIFGYTQGALTNAAPSVLTATVNPYKYFADILGPTDGLAFVTDEPLTNDEGRGVFAAGSTNTRRYAIRFPVDPAPQIIFGYAVDCSWNLPSPNPPDEIPNDFPIEANQPESYRVAVIPTANTLYYDSESGIGGGVLRLQINVHDWQGQVAGDFPGEVSAVRILAPGMMSGVVDGVFLNQTTIKGRYTADLTGLAVPDEAGDKLVICRVESSDGSTYRQAAAPAPDDPLSAFHVITLDIPDPECEGDATNDWSEAIEISFGDAVADQVCLPDDYRDFYSFEIPQGFAAVDGEIWLYCDAEPTKLGLYDESQTLIDESDISSGVASIDLDELEMTPGSYYIRVWTSNSLQVAPYLLELRGELESRIPSNVTDITPPGLFVKPYHMWLHGDYLYCVGPGVWVFDMSFPINPEPVFGVVSSAAYYTISDAAFYYPYCYYSMSNFGAPAGEIVCIDFSDPYEPVIHEEILTFDPELPRKLTINSEHLYVSTNEEPTPDFRVYDWATDPLHPALLASQDIVEEATCAVLVDPEGDDTNLILTGHNTFYCWDVENPGLISDHGSLGVAPMYEINDIAVYEQQIYLAYVEPVAGDGYMNTYILESGGPVYQGHVDVPGTADYLALRKPYAYLGSGPEGLVVCDINDISDPAFIDNYTLTNDAMNLAVNGGLLCIRPMFGSFCIFDLCNPTEPIYINRHRPVNDPLPPYFTHDGYMLVAHTNDRSVISTIDISDPASIAVVAEGYIPVSPDHSAVDWEEEQMVISDNLVMAVVDISNPLAISAYAGYLAAEEINSIAIHGRAVYCGYEDAGTAYIYVYGITDPSSPYYHTTLTYDSFYSPRFMIYGDFLLVRNNDAVRIYSITNDLSPDYIDSLSSSGTIFDMKIVNDYLYLNLSNLGLTEIWDISDPTTPVEVGSGVNGTISQQGMAIDGQFAYFSGNTPSVNACWIYPPDDINPYGIVFYDKFAGGSLDAHDGILYKIALDKGFRIFDLY